MTFLAGTYVRDDEMGKGFRRRNLLETNAYLYFRHQSFRASARLFGDDL